MKCRLFEGQENTVKECMDAVAEFMYRGRIDQQRELTSNSFLKSS